MPWYVLFVKTGYEDRAVDEISNERLWEVDGIRPFAPMYDACFRKLGDLSQERRQLFPGYVFIDTDIAGTDFAVCVREYIYRSEYVLKLLRYGRGYNDFEYEMNEKEKRIWSKLLNQYDCIAMSKGLIVGDLVQIIDGPLQGLESRIKKVNRHRMKAVIEIEVMGVKSVVTVGLEIVSKMP